MELIEIEVGYDYQVLARQKRKREAQWMLASAAFDAMVPSVDDADAPEVGLLLNGAGAVIERYRAWNGRLYRECSSREQRQGVHVPLSLAEARNGGPFRDGAVGLIPWKQQEGISSRLYGNDIAEAFEDRRGDAMAAIAMQSRQILVAGGVVCLPTDPPMLSVNYVGEPLYLLSGTEMAESDPTYSIYGNNYASMFRADRMDDALAFVTVLQDRLVREGMINPPQEEPRRPTRSLSIADGAEHLFMVDDMVESARRNMTFTAHHLAESVTGLDSGGMRAFASLREAILAMDSPEGRTRGNARTAYEAVCGILEAGPSGWCGPSAARLKMAEIQRNSGHLRDRYRFDASFAPQADEILTRDEADAVSMLGA